MAKNRHNVISHVLLVLSCSLGCSEEADDGPLQLTVNQPGDDGTTADLDATSATTDTAATDDGMTAGGSDNDAPSGRLRADGSTITSLDAGMSDSFAFDVSPLPPDTAAQGDAPSSSITDTAATSDGTSDAQNSGSGDGGVTDGGLDTHTQVLADANNLDVGTTTSADTTLAPSSDTGTATTPDTGSQPKPTGASPASAAPSCASIHDAHPAKKSGLYWLKPKTAVAAARTWCEMNKDGGGWAVIAVSADDDKKTWTWKKRHLWSTNKTTVGSSNDLAADFKSSLYHQLPMKDVLFIHLPSGTWASYHNVGTGNADFGAKVAEIGEPKCWSEDDGWPMTAGTLKKEKGLCSTKLYISPLDHDGNKTCGDDEHAYGPAWSASDDGDCPFDDPGQSGGLGPVADKVDKEEECRGFGEVLNLNKKGKGKDRDRIWVLVR